MAIDVQTSNATTKGDKGDLPTLLHSSLHDIPQSIRFPLAGTISNAIFIAGFNASVAAFESERLPAARIYSVFYCLFIPFAHALNSLVVFGWPSPYLPNLLSNAPIGLTAMALGTFCTGYFDRIQLEATIDQFLIRFGIVSEPEPDEERSEFYCSLLVMAITGVWSYALSVYVNSSPSEKGKKKTN